MIQLYRMQMPGGVSANLDFTLFVGPVTCFYHNCGGQVGSDRTAALCPSDVHIALGTQEDMIIEALEEICEKSEFLIRSVKLFTACQSAFCNLDFPALEKRVTEQLGLLCLHQENNRIMLADPSRGRYGSGRSGKREGDFLRLAHQIPEERSGDDRGFLLLSGAETLDSSNELMQAVESWGFDWMQSTAEWRSFEALKQARNAEFALVANMGLLAVAEALNAAWGLEYIVLPTAYNLDAVDEAYELMNRRFGAEADVSEARERAGAAIEFAQGVCAGRHVELQSVPQNLIESLQFYGIDAEQVDFRRAMMRPNAPRGRGLRSGDEHFPTSGGPIRRSNGAPAYKPQPSSSSFWGYRAIEDAFSRLVEEVDGR